MNKTDTYNNINTFGIFELNPNQHERIFDPVKYYIEHSSSYLSTKLDIPIEEARAFVIKNIKDKSITRNPIVKYRERDIIGNVKKGLTTTLNGYLNYIKESPHITVPSLTMYFNPNVKKSLHSEFISNNIRSRNEHKKLAAKYKLEKNIVKSNYHNVLQKTFKNFNNNLSGAYASKGTIMYNPSCHYTLTSITRSVATIGNAISEALIAGNFHYRSPEIALNHIVGTVNKIDTETTKMVINKYNLYIPTTDDIIRELVIKSSYRYWSDETELNNIREYIDKLSDVDKVKVLYTNNLKNIRDFNNELVKDMFSIIMSNDNINISNPKEIINNLPEWLLNMVIHLAYEDLKGKKFELDNFDDALLQKLANIIIKIEKSFSKYFDLIQCFLVTKHFPPSMAYIKDIVRDTIVLSDTDSTCATYQDWVEWYFNNLTINQDSISVSAIIMTIVTRVADHYIKVFAMNMNIGLEKAQLLKMKNEFFWTVFVNTPVSKHYYSLVKIVEGVALEEEELEMKGVHLLAPTAFKVIRARSKEIMTEILTKLDTNEKISVTKYINDVLSVEILLYKYIISGNSEIFKKSKIKEANSYKLTPDKSPYNRHTFWQMVFSKKYGDAPEPPYVTVNVPLKINNVTSMKEFLKHIESKDKNIYNNLLKYMKEFDKKELKVLYLPLNIIGSKGIPDELKQFVDIDKIIIDNCKVLYMILGTLGYNIKPNTKLMDIYLDKDSDGNYIID